MSLRAWDCQMERRENKEVRGEMPQSSHQEKGARTPPRGQRKALGGQQARRAHVDQTTPPALWEALPGSWRETQWAGQKEELPEGGGCVAVGGQSTHPATLKQSVPFLSYPLPPSLLPHWSSKRDWPWALSPSA